MTKRLSMILMMAAILAVAAFGCSSHENEGTQTELPVASVEVKDVADHEGAGFFETVGRVKNLRESTLASKVMGTVKGLKVKAGDKVKKGQMLVRIDEKDVAGQVQQASGALAQAKAALTIAKTNYDRFADLKKSGSASQAEYDKALFDYQTAQGAVKQAQGALATASSYLAEARLTAPFDGVVVDTMIEEGEMVAPGRPLIRIEGKSKLEFETAVAEQDVDLLSVGQKVTVQLDATRNEKREVAGEISEIVPSSDGTHSNTIRVKLADSDGLRSGMFGRARFPRPDDAQPSVLVAKDRIVRHGQLAALYVVDYQDTVRLRLIREGRQIGQQKEILSGLRTSDRLVLSDIASLIDGQPAKVVE